MHLNILSIAMASMLMVAQAGALPIRLMSLCETYLPLRISKASSEAPSTPPSATSSFDSAHWDSKWMTQTSAFPVRAPLAHVEALSVRQKLLQAAEKGSIGYRSATAASFGLEQAHAASSDRGTALQRLRLRIGRAWNPLAASRQHRQLH
ncbi:hypothetical protein IE81DRAFT_349716 [Ceraceosorus guamensis]|uniref:SCP domain-containing protein n=1 Tax=Ceraceosorus guamensis TaxID=1522189 RepID=A0A316VQL7_9BASI|nr:hypothetical protein IE81DRAFT_349716 [Ceraceosorus guamensis]PWN39939.1 hypothetical protein IE81DRAFT_349716 [Ceraceosorus guamensis]